MCQSCQPSACLIARRNVPSCLYPVRSATRQEAVLSVEWWMFSRLNPICPKAQADKASTDLAAMARPRAAGVTQ